MFSNTGQYGALCLRDILNSEISNRKGKNMENMALNRLQKRPLVYSTRTEVRIAPITAGNVHIRWIKFLACGYPQMTTKMPPVWVWGLQINFSKQVNSQIHHLWIMSSNSICMHLVNFFKAQYKSQNNLQNKSYFG